jgi:hypothetical protein
VKALDGSLTDRKKNELMSEKEKNAITDSDLLWRWTNGKIRGVIAMFRCWKPGLLLMGPGFHESGNYWTLETG